MFCSDTSYRYVQYTGQYLIAINLKGNFAYHEIYMFMKAQDSYSHCNVNCRGFSYSSPTTMFSTKGNPTMVTIL